MEKTLVTDAEELQEHHTPEVCVKRINSEEVLVIKGGDKFISHAQME